MKTNKLNLIIVIILFFAGWQVQAQADSTLFNPYPKYEIGVSYGLFPIFYTMPVVNKFTLACPNLNYSYMYNFNAKHAIGTTISFLFSTYEPPDFEDRIFMFSQQLQYKYTYLRKKKMSLYFSISAGFLLVDSYDNIKSFFWGRWYFLSYQVDFLGISFGKKHNGIVELGWGNQGCLKIGYSYKF
jgi:hypothetical protein